VRLGQQEVSVATIVNAAGAWADQVAGRCGVASLGIQPKRRTMVQLRVDRKAIRGLPQVLDALGRFYFKGEGDNVVWLSPHDEIDTDPCDAAPEEMDVAIAIDRFQSAVDWGVAAVERKWAGLRSFAPDRLPVYGFDPAAEGFFWCAGQGGFGIQTAPAAAHIGAALLLDEPQDERFAHIDVEAFSPARFRA
jgi:D-arginine dehydrogenase